MEGTMRLPNTAHQSQPWRIHELTRDFRRDPSESSSRPVRTLFALRWKIGELLGWDGPEAGLGLLGTAYLAAIRPFRHLIVYPAILREWPAA
jgi:hypothetical protein